MKKILLLLLAILISGFCSVPLLAQDDEFSVLTVADGTTTNSYVPFYGYWLDQPNHSQIIYTENMLTDMAGGTISQIQFYASSNPSFTNTMTVSLGICEATTLSSFDSETELTQVYNGSINFSNNILTILFDTPFEYGGGNLMIDVQTTSGNYAGCNFYGVNSNGSSIHAYGTNSASSRNFIPKTSFTYTGGALCKTPNSLMASEVTTESATITWSESEDFSSYTVQWMPASSTNWDNAEEETVYSNSIDISGLNASTTYKVRVQLNCSDETTTSWSAVYTFSTSCGAIDVSTVSWLEDFESYSGSGENDFSPCWTIPLKPNGPFVYCGHSQSCHSGSNSAEFKGQPAYIILPEFEQDITELRLSFWATATSTSTGSVKVGVVTNPDDYNTFIELTNAGTPGPRGGSGTGHGNFMGPFSFDALNTEEDLSNARIALYYTSTSSTESWNLDDFTVSVIPECASPLKNSVTITDVTAHEATVTWIDDDESHSAWIVYYKDATTEDWMSENVSGETTLELTGLAPQTTYQVYVVTDCGTSYDNPDATNIKTFSTVIACPAPTAVTINNITTTTATVTWTSNADSFIVTWSDGENEETETVYENNIVLENLAAATNYTVNIKVDCGGEDGISQPATSTFSTAICEVEDQCGYTFELADSYGDGWNGNKLIVKQNNIQVATLTLQSGNSNTIVLPLCKDLETQLVWGTGNYASEVSFTVYTNDGSILLQKNTGSMSNVANNTVLHAFTSECPTCMLPANLQVSQVSTTSATISWASNAESFVVTYEDYEETVNENSITLTNLEPSSIYTVNVVADCGEDNMSNAATITFLTSCEPISVADIAWTSDFEGTDEVYLNCWTSALTSTRNGKTYPHIEPTATIAHGGNSALEVAFGDIVTALPAFEEEISTLEFTFWAKHNAWNSNYANNLELGYITEPNDATTFVPTDTFNTTTYTRFVKSFTALADLDLPSSTRIAFRFIQGDADNLTSWYLDDMQVNLVPTCNAPVYNSVAISNVTAESAAISFTDEDSSHDAWMIYYRPVNSTDEYENVEVNETADNVIEGLMPNTTYTVFVKSVCDGNVGENQTDAKTFTTTTIPAELPLVVDFEDELENASWVLLNGTQNNKWYIGTDTAATVNNTEDGEIALYISNDGGATNAYTNGANRVYAYRDILVPDGTTELLLSFDWKANGRTSAEEFLRVYWLDPSVNITAGNNPPSGNDASAQPGNYGADATEHWLARKTEWQHEEMIIKSDQFEGMGNGDKVYRLAFHWRNYSNYNSVQNPPASVDNIILKALECTAPVGLEVIDIEENSATVNWIGDADEYSVIVTQGSNSTYQTVSTNFIYLEDLMSSTNTTVKVRSLCGDDSSSVATISFNTSCGAITITESTPFFEDFEGYPGSNTAVELSICWPTPETATVNNGVSPFVYTGYSQACHSGGNSVEFKGNGSAFTLPEFTNDLKELRLSFWATATSTSTGSVKVGYVTDVTNISTFVELFNAGTPGPRGSDGNSTGNGNYMGPFDFNGLEIPEGARLTLRHINSSTQSWNIDDIKVELIPDCPSPVKNSVTFTNIAGHVATVSWVDNDESHDSWTVFYKAATADEWESEVVNSVDTLELTGLNPETTYQVYVITNCGDTPENPDATNIKTFTTTIACPAPSGITFGNVGMTSATVSWTGNAESYIVEYGEAGFTPGEGETLVVNENSVELSNLESSTNYTVIIKADCGEEDGISSAATATFTTLCDVVSTFPYTESFENGIGCWSTNSLSGSTNWTIATAYQSTTIPDGFNYAKLYNASSTLHTTELVSPIMDLTSLENPYLSFYHIQEAWFDDQDQLYVYYRTSPSSEKVLLTSFTENIASWQKDSIALPSPSAEYQIIFEGHAKYGRGVGVDLVNIYSSDGETPVVTEPTVVTNNASDITQTSATLNGEITDLGNQTITARGFEWKQVGGTATTVNATGTDMTATINGLTAATEYTFRAFATTANTTTYGDWKNFTTFDEQAEPCNAPTNVTISDVAAESFVVTWNANGASKWNVRYRVQNAATWISATVETTPSYAVTGLQPETAYEVQVQAVCENETSEWSTSATATTTTGLSELSKNIILYPNPATNFIDVRVSDNDVTVSRLKVYDVYGKLISEVEVVENPTRINVSTLAGGMYFVKVVTGNGTVTKSFIRK